MQKTIFLRLFLLLSLFVLMTGCGNQESVQSYTENTSVSESVPVSEQEETRFFAIETSPSFEVEGPEPSVSQVQGSTISVTDEPEQILSVQTLPQKIENPSNESNEEVNSEMKMNVNVNGQNFTATLENNSAVDALVQMMENGPVTLQLSDYAGFEKVGPLGQSLPASNSQTTTHAGDIVLYQGNQIVMFYGSNAWSYTRLGHIDDLTGWEEALGSGDVTVTLSMEG